MPFVVVDIKLLRQLCIDMSITYADAVVGFERERGKTSDYNYNSNNNNNSNSNNNNNSPQPIYGGIIVLNENYLTIQEKINHIINLNKKQILKLKEFKNAKKWEEIVRNAMRREMLRQRHGA